MKITIFEDSFDPPLQCDEYAAKELSQHCDKLIIVPDNTESAADRMRLCELAFKDIDNASLSDMEILKEGKCYTVELLENIKKIFPSDEISLAVWRDKDIRSFWRSDDIFSNCNVIEMDRETEESSDESIKEKLSSRLGSEMLGADVYSEIIRNHWYDAIPDLSWLREKVIDYLDTKRIAHVAGCEQEAVRLARYWGEDEDKAATAGILHDITKKCTYEEQIELIKKYGIDCDEEELKIPKLLHARTGAELSKDIFGISDEIYSAIRYHTTAKPDMTLLEKIIYIADYIEPNREFDGVDELRNLAYKDINECMKLGLEMSLAEIKDKGQDPYKDTKEAYEYYATT